MIFFFFFCGQNTLGPDPTLGPDVEELTRILNEGKEKEEKETKQEKGDQKRTKERTKRDAKKELKRTMEEPNQSQN